MDEITVGLDGAVKSMDDFLVNGKDTKEHGIRLRRFLYRVKVHSITLNLGKCVFRGLRTKFFGCYGSPEKIKPLNKKIKAINRFPQSTSITEFKRFRGMAQHLSRFCPKLSKVTEP